MVSLIRARKLVRDLLPLRENEFSKQRRETLYTIAEDTIYLILRSVGVASAKAAPVTEPVVFKMRCDLVVYTSVRAGLAIVEPSDGLFRVLIENHEDYPAKLCAGRCLGTLSKTDLIRTDDVFNPGILNILTYILTGEVKISSHPDRIWHMVKPTQGILSAIKPYSYGR